MVSGSFDLQKHSIHIPTAFAITGIRQENYRTITLRLDARLKAKPGQFVMVWLPGFDEKPFSLVDGDPVTLMVTAVGPFSHLVHGLNEGDRLWIRGPFGNGFHVGDAQRRLALVGGGYGVAPLFWLARSTQGGDRSVSTFIGARSADDLLFTDYFQDLKSASGANNPRWALEIATEDGSRGQKGLVTHLLEPLLAEGGVDAIFACGPHGLLAALQDLAVRHGTPAQLSWEAYMRCGIGICGACEHDGHVLCMDGPVLSA